MRERGMVVEGHRRFVCMSHVIPKKQGLNEKQSTQGKKGKKAMKAVK